MHHAVLWFTGQNCSRHLPLPRPGRVPLLGSGRIWLGKLLKRSFCCNCSCCSRKLKPEQSILICERWNGKSLTFLFRWRVVSWRAAIISGGGKVTKHGILERNVIYLLLNDSAWPFLKCWSRRALKERVFWHFHTLGTEELAYLGAKWCSLFSKMSIIL